MKVTKSQIRFDLARLLVSEIFDNFLNTNLRKLNLLGAKNGLISLALDIVEDLVFAMVFIFQ